jgi:hypothetical protein
MSLVDLIFGSTAGMVLGAVVIGVLVVILVLLLRSR